MADSKISALPELAAVPATDDEVAIVDTDTGTTKRVSRKNFLGYTEYVALLTQAGVAAPTATVIKNDTGATVSYAYTTTGIYTMTFSSTVLTANKTVITFGSSGTYHYSGIRSSTTLIVLSSGSADGSPANGAFISTAITIRIYE